MSSLNLRFQSAIEGARCDSQSLFLGLFNIAFGLFAEAAFGEGGGDAAFAAAEEAEDVFGVGSVFFALAVF